MESPRSCESLSKVSLQSLFQTEGRASLEAFQPWKPKLSPKDQYQIGSLVASKPKNELSPQRKGAERIGGLTSKAVILLSSAVGIWTMHRDVPTLDLQATAAFVALTLEASHLEASRFVALTLEVS